MAAKRIAPVSERPAHPGSRWYRCSVTYTLPEHPHRQYMVVETIPGDSKMMAYRPWVLEVVPAHARLGNVDITQVMPQWRM